MNMESEAKRLSGVHGCVWCDNGDKPIRLDENGVAAEDGTLSHTSGDSWWPCETQGCSWVRGLLARLHVGGFMCAEKQHRADAGWWTEDGQDNTEPTDTGGKQ